MITAIVNLAVTSYSKADIDAALIGRGYYPLLQILVCGICGAFLTGDIFNLYVWFEVMLMASFGLLVLGQSKPQLDGGVKYVVINLLATLLFLTAIGLLYGLTGTLNLADLHVKVPLIANRGLLDGGRHIVFGRLWNQGGVIPAVFLAAGGLPYAAGFGVGHFFRPVDQSRHLCLDPRVYPGFHR